MAFIKKIKQKFCRHIDEPGNRNYEMPFIGYEFQCPKCQAYVACFEDYDDYIIISELQHNILVEEGKKLYGELPKYWVDK